MMRKNFKSGYLIKAVTSHLQVVIRLYIGVKKIQYPLEQLVVTGVGFKF